MLLIFIYTSMFGGPQKYTHISPLMCALKILQKGRLCYFPMQNLPTHAKF